MTEINIDENYNNNEIDIAKDDYATSEYSFVYFLLAIAVFILEVDVIYALNQKVIIDIKQIIFIHFIVLFVVAAITYIQGKRGKDIRLPLLLLIMTTVTGVIGAGLYIVSNIFYLFFKSVAVPFIKWFMELFPDEKHSETRVLYERILDGLDDYSDHDEIEPFINIMRQGTLRQKQVALTKITRYFQPGFAPALLSAVNDSNNAIRVQAATSIARIEKIFAEKFEALEKLLVYRHDNLNRLKLLASLCKEYAESGILDPERTTKSRDKAIDIYEHCLNIIEGKDDEEGIRVALAYLYMQKNQFDKANDCLIGVIRKGKKTVSVAFVSCYMQVLFKARRLPGVRGIAKQFGNLLDIEDQLQKKQVTEILKLWSEGITKASLVLNRGS